MHSTHASIEQLLEIKDGLETPMSVHVRQCELCAAQLTQLQGITQQLYDSANQPVPAHVLQRIQATVATQFETKAEQAVENPIEPQLLLANGAQQPSRWNSLSTAIYTLALSILVTGLVGFYSLNGQQTVAFKQAEALQASIEQLMLNSRGLESVLQQVNDQGSGLTAAERDVADRLYWRLMYVDQMIHENAKTDQPDPQRIQVLWGDRVNALTELNQLFYGGPNNLGDPEI